MIARAAQMSSLAVAVGVLACAVSVRALRQEPVAPSAPPTLSGTGLFLSDGVTIDPENRAFAPQYPLWTDGATKRRWIRLPAQTTIDVSDADHWNFPVGTRLWKEFSFAGRKVETRFLWQWSAGKWTFASYAWNEAQTEATLVPDGGLANVAEVAPGKRHSIPAISDCHTCHDSARTEILGFDALQLSDDRDPNALHADALTPDMITLRTLLAEGRLTPARPEWASAPPRIPATDPTERAALGYLSTNCGACHNRDSSIASVGLMLKHSVKAGNCSAALDSTIDRRGHWVIPTAANDSRLITPGRPDLSAVVYRMATRRPSSQMPAIGTVVADREAVALVSAWIRDTLARRPVTNSPCLL